MLLLAVFAAGCTDQQMPVAPNEPAATLLAPGSERPPSRMMSGNDTIWGADQELEVTDGSGVVWRLERDGSEGAWTEARIYKNGAYKGTLDYEWSGSTLTGFRWTNTSGDWMDTDEGGDIEDTSAGVYEGCFDPDLECGEGLMSHDCEAEWDETVQSSFFAASTAGLAGMLSAASIPNPGVTPFAVGAIVMAAGAGINAFIDLAFWACCELC